MVYTFVWLGLMIFFLIAEAMTVGLTTIWFAGGALAALLVSLGTGNIWIQVIFFLLVSFILLWAVRPFALKYMKPNKMETNYKSTIGKIGRVIEKIDNRMETGRISVDGQEWMARSKEDTLTFEIGEMVRIVEIAGVKAIVESEQIE